MAAHTDTRAAPEVPGGLEDREGSGATTEATTEGLAALEGTEGTGEVLVGRAGRGITAAGLGRGPMVHGVKRIPGKEGGSILHCYDTWLVSDFDMAASFFCHFN